MQINSNEHHRTQASKPQIQFNSCRRNAATIINNDIAFGMCAEMQTRANFLMKYLMTINQVCSLMFDRTVNRYFVQERCSWHFHNFDQLRIVWYWYLLFKISCTFAALCDVQPCDGTKYLQATAPQGISVFPLKYCVLLRANLTTRVELLRFHLTYQTLTRRWIWLEEECMEFSPSGCNLLIEWWLIRVQLMDDRLELITLMRLPIRSVLQKQLDICWILRTRAAFVLLSNIYFWI